jgi:replicative DNA helicase
MIMAKTFDQKDMVPNDLDLERIILGAVILAPSSFDLIRFLEVDDFYTNKHKTIYEAMTLIDQNNEYPDQIAVADRIDLMGRAECFEDQESFPYLVGLVNDAFSSSEIERNARRLREIAICRTLYLGSGPLAGAAHTKNAEDAMQVLEELTQTVRAKDTSSELAPISRGLTSFMERLDYLHEHRGAITGVSTGLTDLDRLTGGLQKSDLIILAARPAVGKTSMCLTIARNAAKRGHGVAVFSLEMSQEQLIQRFMAMEAGVDQTRLRNGWIEDDEWERIMVAMNTLNDAPIFIDDTSGISCIEIRSKLRRLIASGQKPELVIVDYLQLMQAFPGSTSGKKSENRTQEVSEISRQLKGLARELDVPVMALAQLSRAVESRQSKIPQLSDLRESGSIEQDSDIVMFIYREDVYNPESERKNIADIIVAKHRNGPVGEVSLYIQASQTCFRDLEVTPPSETEVEY